MFTKIDKNLDKVNQVKSLAFSIAHETRNPLAGIKGCCELMKNNLNELIEYIDLIYDSSNQGLAMIDMILMSLVSILRLTVNMDLPKKERGLKFQDLVEEAKD